MKQENKNRKQLELFDQYGRKLNHEETSSTVKSREIAVDFLSELRAQQNSTTTLLTKIMDYGNLRTSIRAVRQNKGAAGVDGWSIAETEQWLSIHYKDFTETVKAGKYKVKEVKLVEIPKADGGVRELGIPTVLDRIIQQAIHQQLSPLYDRHFSESSYGFRKGRNAHMAIERASEYIAAGNEWVVDIDLKNYFDIIPHNRLMQRLSNGIGDKELLKLIHQYLKAKMMAGGMVSQRTEGSPQGGPLSPLLSNIVLDELDKELEKRGHKFCRYADDCNIFVKSEKAGERVMESIIQFIEEKLKLKVNRIKSGVRHCSKVKFLGYTVSEKGKIRISDKSIARLKKKVIEKTKRNSGVAFSKLIEELNLLIQGFGVYYKMANHWLSNLRDIDGWIRRRLRCYRLKQCGRTYTIVKFLQSLNTPVNKSWNAAYWSNKSWWALAADQTVSKAMSNNWFNELGLKSILVTIKRY
jgi:RNA-directed DNA polymerase